MEARNARSGRRVLGHTAKPRNAPRVDAIDAAERDWTSDVPKEDARIYAISARILYVASLVEWSFEREAQRVGLNTGEVLVLDTLRRFGPPYEASPVQLKKHFLISFAGIGKRLGRLDELGYIQRRAHATDRRSQFVRLTSAGLALLHRHENAARTPHRHSLMRLSAVELRSLVAILKKVQSGIEAGVTC